MDWSVFYKQLLMTLGGIGVVMSIMILFGKKWLDARIKESVRYEYDKKLEEHKARLQEQTNRSIQEMQAEFQDAVDQKATDKALFAKFLEALPSSGSIDFIRTFNMAGWSFNRNKLEQLHEFDYVWRQPEYHFLDDELDRKRGELHAMIGEYLTYIVINTRPLETNLDWSSVPEELEEEQPERFREVVEKLHSLAGQIVAAHEDLVKTARKNLKC